MLSRVQSVKRTLWIGTADIKDLYVEVGKEKKPFLALIAHLILAFAPQGVPFWGYLSMVFLGFGYSLVPAALWPSVPKIVPDKVLGTTFALIYWVQNLGLLSFKMAAGGIIGGNGGPVGVEIMFVALCIAALAVALIFARVSNRHPDLGLDKPSSAA